MGTHAVIIYFTLCLLISVFNNNAWSFMCIYSNELLFMCIHNNAWLIMLKVWKKTDNYICLHGTFLELKNG